MPPALQRVLQHCLEKDPAHRFQDAHDLAFALGNIADSAAPITAPFASRNRRTTSLWAALAVLIVLGAALGGWAFRGGPAPPPTFRKLTFGSGAIDGARFVPGSRDIAYSARWQGTPSTVYLLREGSLEPRALEAPGAMLLGTSSQGGAAVLTRPVLYNGLLVGTLSVLPLAGGGTREVSRAATAVDFPADGSGPCLVAVAKQNQFQREWPPGEILLGPGRSILRNPRVRGSQVAFLQSTPASFAEGEIRVMAKGGQPRPLARCKGFTALAWGPGGDEIWFSTFDGGESRIQAVTSRAGPGSWPGTRGAWSFWTWTLPDAASPFRAASSVRPSDGRPVRVRIWTSPGSTHRRPRLCSRTETRCCWAARGTGRCRTA